MKRTISSLLTVFALGITAISAAPVTYDFTFDSGHGMTVTGTFDAEGDADMDGFFDSVVVTKWSASGGDVVVVDNVPTITRSPRVRTDGTVAGLYIEAYTGSRSSPNLSFPYFQVDEDDQQIDLRADGFSFGGAWVITNEMWCIGVCSADADGDGVSDDIDQCPDSDLSATIVINGFDTGVPNEVDAVGCTHADLIAEAILFGPGNSNIVALLVGWKADGLISGREMGSMLRAINTP